MPTPLRVAVVDDHTLVRAGLVAIVERSEGMEITASCASGTELLTALAAGVPADVCVVDVLMQAPGGFETLVELTRRPDPPAVLMISAHGRAEVAIRCIRAGARGFLSKDCDPVVFAQALRRVAGGGMALDPTLTGVVIDALTSLGAPAPPGYEALSDREMEVFLRLAAGQTAAQAGAALALSPKTVSTYRRRILDKLALDNNAQMTTYAIVHGLLETSPRAPAPGTPVESPTGSPTGSHAGPDAGASDTPEDAVHEGPVVLPANVAHGLMRRHPTLPVGMVVTDTTAVVRHWNRHATRTWRRPAAAAVNRSLASLLEDPTPLTDMAAALASGQEWSGLILPRPLRPEARRHPLRALVVPLISAAGSAGAVAFTLPL